MKRKLRRDGSEIHTRHILLVLFREYAANEIQVFKYLNCFSPLNLTTSSSPQRFFTRDVTSYLYASERGIRRSEIRFLMGTQNFLFVPRCDTTKKKHLSLFLYRAQKLAISLISTYKHYAIDIADPSSMQDACHMNCVIDLAHRGVSVAQWL